MTIYNSKWRFRINVPCSSSLQMCPAVLWSLLCSSFMEYKQQTVSIHLPFVPKLHQLTESCYVTDSKIVGARFSSAQRPVFHYSLLHPFKKSKRVLSMDNSLTCVWWTVVFSGKTIRELLEKKNMGDFEKFQIEGKICNKNVALFGFVHIPHGLISVSWRDHWIGYISCSPIFLFVYVLEDGKLYPRSLWTLIHTGR